MKLELAVLKNTGPWWTPACHHGLWNLEPHPLPLRRGSTHTTLLTPAESTSRRIGCARLLRPSTSQFSTPRRTKAAKDLRAMFPSEGPLHLRPTRHGINFADPCPSWIRRHVRIKLQSLRATCRHTMARLSIQIVSVAGRVHSAQTPGRSSIRSASAECKPPFERRANALRKSRLLLLLGNFKTGRTKAPSSSFRPSTADRRARLTANCCFNQLCVSPGAKDRTELLSQAANFRAA